MKAQATRSGRVGVALALALLMVQPLSGAGTPFITSEEKFDLALAQFSAQLVGGACPLGAPVRTYNVTALPVPISYNHWGDIDLQGMLFVPDADRAELLTDVGDKVAFAGLGTLADHVVELRDSLVAYDISRAMAASAAIASEGESLRMGGTTPRERVDVSELVQPLVLRAYMGECVRVQLLNVLTAPVSFHVHAAISAPGSGEAAGMNGPDLVAPGAVGMFSVFLPDWPGIEGAHFVHSHADSRHQTRHGLFGAIVAEKVGTRWLSVKDGVTFAPTSIDAIIDAPAPASDHREFVQIYHDEVDLVDWQLQPLPQVSNISKEYGVGTKAISLRNEPFYDRFLYQDGSYASGESNRAHDKSQSYGSYTYGDPATRIQMSYLGDPVKYRTINAGPGQPHIHHLHGGGIRWRTSPIADPTQFDAGLTKQNPVDTAASQRVDVQNMNPGESFNIEPEGGSGGVQQSVGDFLYHCHIAEHYLAGMWSFWRVFNTLQPGVAPLPDRVGATAGAVNSAALVGSTVGGTTLTSESLAAWVESQLPARGVPGEEDASVWNWGLRMEGDKPVYLGEPESAIAFPNWKADAPGRLPAGERPEIGFDPITGRLAYPLLRPHFGERPPFAPDHGPAPYLGKDASQARPDGLCPSEARPLNYNVVAVPAKVSYNKFDTDPKAEVFVRAEDRAQATGPSGNPTSLVLRANAGDCVDVLLTNALKETTPDESSIGVHRKTNIHIHLVQFDVQASDGVVTGFNYETTLRPLEGAHSKTTVTFPGYGEFLIGDPSAMVNTKLRGATTIVNGNTVVPVVYVDPFLDATGAPKIGSKVGVDLGRPGTQIAKLIAVDIANGLITLEGELNPHNAGEIIGYEFVRYRWYPDVDLGVVYFHDHVNGLDTWRHGLFGSLVVEPRGSRWLSPTRTSDDVPDDATSHVVDIIPANGAAFRELVLHFQDRGCVDASDCVDLSRPLMPDVKIEPAAFNLRAEPLWRRNAAAPFSSTAPAPAGGLPQGDPGTDTLQAYTGDAVEVRLVYSGQSASRGVGTFAMTGHRFQVEENLPGSRTQDAMSMAVSSQHNWRLECGAGGCAQQPGDYLYYMSEPGFVQRGAWGLFRVLGAPDAALRPLPSNPTPTVGAIGAPTRFYDVSAIETNVVHNLAQGIQSTMKRFVPTTEAAREMRNMSTTRDEPLVIRAVAGEVIQVNLTNALPAGSGRVGLHAGLVTAGPGGQGITVGNGPQQTVAPGETISYIWHADRELGVADLVSLANPVRDAIDGLFGALVIEPAGAKFKPAIGASSWITMPSGKVIREHVLLMSSEDAQFDSSTMPYLPDVQGRTLINYATEPLSRGASVPLPLGRAALTGVDTCQTDDGCAPRPVHFRNPMNPVATQMARPWTPVLDAQRGQPLILRVVGSAGDQQAAFHLDGHAFATDADMPSCRTDLSQCKSNLVSTFTVGPRETRNIWIPEVGQGGSGDYMYRNHRDAFFEAGAWGILRVR